MRPSLASCLPQQAVQCKLGCAMSTKAHSVVGQTTACFLIWSGEIGEDSCLKIAFGVRFQGFAWALYPASGTCGIVHHRRTDGDTDWQTEI